MINKAFTKYSVDFKINKAVSLIDKQYKEVLYYLLNEMSLFDSLYIPENNCILIEKAYKTCFPAFTYPKFRHL